MIPWILSTPLCLRKQIKWISLIWKWKFFYAFQVFEVENINFWSGTNHHIVVLTSLPGNFYLLNVSDIFFSFFCNPGKVIRSEIYGLMFFFSLQWQIDMVFCENEIALSCRKNPKKPPPTFWIRTKIKSNINLPLFHTFS